MWCAGLSNLIVVANMLIMQTCPVLNKNNITKNVMCMSFQSNRGSEHVNYINYHAI